MDAAQIQDFLERRAGASPPNNQIGHGALNLGAPSGVTPPTDRAIRHWPVRSAFSTRDTTTGGHHSLLGPTQAVTVPVSNLPADATAVAINLTGTSVKQTTFLASYPADRLGRVHRTST